MKKDLYCLPSYGLMFSEIEAKTKTKGKRNDYQPTT